MSAACREVYSGLRDRDLIRQGLRLRPPPVYIQRIWPRRLIDGDGCRAMFD